MADNYKQIRLLGEGAFGKCYLVENQQDGTKRVLKQIDIRKMSEAEKREALKEAKILRAFEHPNIIQCYDSYTTKTGKLCILMDFADGGDLEKKVRGQRGRFFTENQIMDWMVQLCLALKHVHDRKVLHRDIKCQNIFLTRDNIVKMGDFGIARVLNNTKENAKTMVGTPYYLSPEIVENRPYSFKSDIWSLGVVLYELCTLKPPFDASSLHFLALKIVRGVYPPLPTHFSRDMKELVKQMLSTNPNQRPSINQILRKPFVKSRIQNFLTETIIGDEFSHTALHQQQLLNPPRGAQQDNRQRPQPKVPEVQQNRPQSRQNEQRQPYVPRNQMAAGIPSRANPQPQQNRPPPPSNPQQVRPPPPVSNRPPPNNPPVVQNRQPVNPPSSRGPPKPNYHYEQQRQKPTPSNLQQKKQAPQQPQWKQGVAQRPEPVFRPAPPQEAPRRQSPPQRKDPPQRAESPRYREIARKEPEPVFRPPPAFRPPPSDYYQQKPADEGLIINNVINRPASKQKPRQQQLGGNEVDCAEAVSKKIEEMRYQREQEEREKIMKKKESDQKRQAKAKERSNARQQMLSEIKRKRQNIKKKGKKDVQIEWMGGMSDFARKSLQDIQTEPNFYQPQEVIEVQENPIQSQSNFGYEEEQEPQDNPYEFKLVLTPAQQEHAKMLEKMKEAMDLQEDDETQDDSNPDFAQAYDLDTINEEDEDRDDEIEEITQESAPPPQPDPSPFQYYHADDDSSSFSKLEMLRMYLEEQIGDEVLVAAYKVVKEYADIDNEDWGYESCYEKLKEIMTSDK